jgi:hypothetical protein
VNPSQEPVLYPYGPATEWPPPEEQKARRSWRRVLGSAAVCALIIAAAGGPLGLLWTWLAPGVPVIDAGTSGIVVNDPSPEEYVAADGWFTMLGFGFGLLAAVVAWLVLRRSRGPALLLGVVFGTLGAALIAWQGGRRLGLSAYEHWRETAVSGGTYAAPPDLHAHGALLVPAFGAAIVLTLLAGWSNDPDLDLPGAKPGYGPNLGAADSYPGGQAGSQPEGPAGDQPGAPVSSDWPGEPDPTAAPAPPGPGPAGPPPG